MIKSGIPLVSAQQRNIHQFEPDSVNIGRTGKINVVHRAVRVYPAGESVVGTSDERQPVFYGTEGGGRGVLPLRGALVEPAIVGQVQDEICLVVHRGAGQVRKDIFEANQDRSFEAQVGNGKPTGSVSAGETSQAGHVFDPRKAPAKGNVFSEDDEAALAVASSHLTVGRDKEAAVEVVRFHASI